MCFKLIKNLYENGVKSQKYHKLETKSAKISAICLKGCISVFSHIWLYQFEYIKGYTCFSIQNTKLQDRRNYVEQIQRNMPSVSQNIFLQEICMNPAPPPPPLPNFTPTPALPPPHTHTHKQKKSQTPKEPKYYEISF